MCDSQRYWVVPASRLSPRLRRGSPSSVAHGRDIDNFLSIGRSQAPRWGVKSPSGRASQNSTRRATPVGSPDTTTGVAHGLTRDCRRSAARMSQMSPRETSRHCLVVKSCSAARWVSTSRRVRFAARSAPRDQRSGPRASDAATERDAHPPHRPAAYHRVSRTAEYPRLLNARLAACADVPLRLLSARTDGARLAVENAEAALPGGGLIEEPPVQLGGECMDRAGQLRVGLEF